MCKPLKLKSKEELLSVAEEIAFAKALAANDKNLRDRALKKLKKWFLFKSNQDSQGIKFTEEGFMRLWKGLFYCVWMSDKPLIQEECVESISNLVHCFTDIEDARKFIRCFFQSISQAWFSLDGHRIDKYFMLVRRFLRQILEYLDKSGWEEEKVSCVCNDLNKALEMAPIGLILHLTEVYLEEVAKVGRGSLEAKTVLQMIKPFADFMAVSTDTRIFRYVNDFIFLYLLRQSEEGVKHGAKFNVWKQMGFPEGDINVIQEASDEEVDEDDELSDDDISGDSEGALDPRAGHVDAILPPLDFDPNSIKEYLSSLCKRKDTTSKARKTISFLTKKYDKFIEGKYPLGIHKVEVPEKEDREQIINDTAQELLNEDKNFAMERNMYKKGRQIVMLNSWEVTPVREKDLHNLKDEFSNKGNWKVRSSKKRKRKSKVSVNSTMKKIKVTLDDSLLDLSIGENNVDSQLPSSNTVEGEEIPVITETFSTNPMGHNSKKSWKLLKRKKANNCGLSQLGKRGKYESILETLRNLDAMMEKKQEEKRQKIEQAHKDWGLSNSWDPSVNEEEIVIPFTPGKPNDSIINSSDNNEPPVGKKTPSSGKKVEFVLSRNTAQEMKEYKKALRESPSVPVSFEKKPLQGVLKTSHVRSPINPFYQEQAAQQ